MSKTNEQIEYAVRRALSDDPRLPFADEIAVEAYDGLVTLRGAALERLMSDPMLDANCLDVRVKDAWVTLTGDADRQFQSDRAFDHMIGLRGVIGVTNEIKVEERLPDR